MNDCYRACASLLVMRPKGTAGAWEMLLLRKPRKRDAWQLPQGGVEAGENTESAALRELKEEAGITATIIGLSKRCYQYDFPESFRRFRPDHVCGQCIRFVFAMFDPGQGIVVDGKEIDAYKWVAPEEVSRYIKRRAYLRIVQQLVEEAKKLKIEN